MKTVHERIPLAGLNKLPSVPQIAKVTTNPCEKQASSLKPRAGAGVQARPERLCPWRGGRPLCSLALDTMVGVREGDWQMSSSCLQPPHLILTAEAAHGLRPQVHSWFRGPEAWKERAGYAEYCRT